MTSTEEQLDRIEKQLAALARKAAETDRDIEEFRKASAEVMREAEKVQRRLRLAAG